MGVVLNRRQALRSGAALAGVSLLMGCGVPMPLAGKPASVRRVGFLNEATAPTPSNRSPGFDAWQQQMAELGWIEGQNLIVEYRFAAGAPERLPDLAAELVRAGVEVIATWTPPEADAARRATSTIPIVAGSADPVRQGLVMSLARPGGNITGIVDLSIELNGKRLELFKECLPGLTRMATLRDITDRGNPMVEGHREVIEQAASRLGIEIIYGEMTEYGQLEETMARLAAQRPDGLYLVPSALWSPITAQVAELAMKFHLPSMAGFSRRQGLLMTYSGNDLDLRRRHAVMVDKILKGAKPADLPFEGPTRYDFVINMKTAQALGLTIPDALLRQATELIQ
jgi:putative ABC transport system substrate-binding protein